MFETGKQFDKYTKIDGDLLFLYRLMILLFLSKQNPYFILYKF